MSEEYKKKLEAFKRGELSEVEAEEMERDLEKVEQYLQVFEEAEMGNQEQAVTPMMDQKKQKKILRKGKWKARFQTAFTALGLIITITIIQKEFPHSLSERFSMMPSVKDLNLAQLI